MTNSTDTLERFNNYIHSFYGMGGVYARDGQWATDTQIKGAIADYLVVLCEDTTGLVTWGHGDSVDRERVAEILMTKYKVQLY